MFDYKCIGYISYECKWNCMWEMCMNYVDCCLSMKRNDIWTCAVHSDEQNLQKRIWSLGFIRLWLVTTETMAKSEEWLCLLGPFFMLWLYGCWAKDYSCGAGTCTISTAQGWSFSVNFRQFSLYGLRGKCFENLSVIWLLHSYRCNVLQNHTSLLIVFRPQRCKVPMNSMNPKTFHKFSCSSHD